MGAGVRRPRVQPRREAEVLSDGNSIEESSRGTIASFTFDATMDAHLATTLRTASGTTWTGGLRSSVSAVRRVVARWAIVVDLEGKRGKGEE